MTRNNVLTRVLILTPTKKDAEVTSSLLMKADVTCFVCKDLRHFAEEVGEGAGAVLLTEEVIRAPGLQDLLNSLRQQPAWSDLPVIMLMQGSVTSNAAPRIIRDLGNITLLERPAPTRSVVSAVQTAIRSRQRQYQIREQMEAIRHAQDEREQLLESESAARQEAERAGRIKDEFLATLSHELRTPLNAIFGWTQLIKMDPGDAEAIAEGINVIDRNVRLQTELIDDLLDMSRIISGKVRLDMRPIKLPEVIDAALDSTMPTLLAKNIRLEKSISPGVDHVNGDPGRLQQVLWNLLSNAIKFTPKGGTIQVLGEQVHSHVEISVTDSGEGIAAEFLPQLFERFTQADASTTRNHGGLGLGLSIVRHLVEMHGGEIHAESPGVGQGATFRIRLPMLALNSAAAEPQHDAGTGYRRTRLNEALRLKGLKILVVDDEPDARDLVRRFLIDCDAIPALAASAEEAELLVASFKPNVIISDIGMPTQDGYAFMRSVRRQGLTIPAVALTAFARDEDRTRSMKAGYQMHLRKPVDPAELIAAVASLAGR
jgi:signal transduction histidine kinase